MKFNIEKRFMQHPSRKWSLGLVAACACVGLGLALAAAETSKKSPLARELSDVVRELNELRRQRQQAPPIESADAAELERLQRQVTETKSQIQALKAKRAKQGTSSQPTPAQPSAAPQPSAQAEPEGPASSATQQLAAASAHALETVEQLRAQEAALGRDPSLWVALAADLRASEPERQRRGLQRFIQQATLKVNASRRVLLENHPVVLEDGTRRIHAFVLEIGSLGRVFLSEDESESGVWNGQRWNTQLDEATHQNILAAVRSARHLEFPRFLPLPVRRDTQAELAASPRSSASDVP